MRIAVVGLGKLGTVIAAVYAEAGHQVVGVDVNPEPVAMVNQGIAPVPEPGLQELIDRAGSNLTATTHFDKAMEGSEASYLIVPTPSNHQGVFTNEFVVDALGKIGSALRGTHHHHTVVLCSTVMPGSCSGELKESLEASSGKSVGTEIGFVYSPEFIALGSIVKNMQFPDLILMGESDTHSGDVAISNTLSVVKNTPSVRRMNLVNAEIVKISINTFVTTKISFANMLGEICDQMVGADVDVVTEAVGADSRIGSKYLKGALGYGGPCFPRDNVALTRLAEGLDIDAAIPRATDAINDRQLPRITKIVADNSPPGATVAVLGLSYKPDTPVCEQSQGVGIANALAAAGFHVFAYDPQGNKAAAQDLLPQVQVSANQNIAISDASTVVITTAWPEFSSLSQEQLSGKFVVDAWGILPEEIGAARPGKLQAVQGTITKENVLA